MNILTELRVACDELDAARTEFDKPMPVSDVEFYKRNDRLLLAISNVQKLSTTDTIRALLDAAEAAAASGCYTCVGLLDSQSAGWPCNAPAARLRNALAPLVKEATDE